MFWCCLWCVVLHHGWGSAPTQQNSDFKVRILTLNSELKFCFPHVALILFRTHEILWCYYFVQYRQ